MSTHNKVERGVDADNSRSLTSFRDSLTDIFQQVSIGREQPKVLVDTSSGRRELSPSHVYQETGTETAQEVNDFGGGFVLLSEVTQIEADITIVT